MSHTLEDGQPSIRPLEREEPAPIPSPDKPDARHHNIRGTGIPRVTTTTPEPAFSQPQASHNPLEVFHDQALRHLRSQTISVPEGQPKQSIKEREP